MYLQMLLEANEAAKGKKTGTEDTDADAKDAKGTDPENAPDDANPDDADTTKGSEEGDEETNDNQNQDDNTDNEETDENNDENEENKDDNPDENNDDTGSDFSMDDDPGSDTDNEPPPDGLVDPDDDGSSDMGQDDTETNVHTNILQLSKLDRTLAKRKCYSNYMDLRTSIGTVKRIIEDNVAKIDPEVRTEVTDNLDDLYMKITDYITIKFPITNYEENLQNYMIFVKDIALLVEMLNPASKTAKDAARKRKEAAKNAKKEED